MAHGLKTTGRDVIDGLRSRVRRQYALRRISRLDHDVLLEKLNEIEAYIINMDEIDPKLEKLKQEIEQDWKRII